MNNIQIINAQARDAAKNLGERHYSILRKLLINGRHKWLNDSTVPRSVNGNRLGLKKREAIAQEIRDANDGLLIKE